MENFAVRVRVPATSANLGPGFDTLGMALQLHSYVTVQAAENGENRVVIKGEGEEYGREAIEKNIAWQAALKLVEVAGIALPKLQITLENIIPLSRGLGSSAAARVGTMVAVNLWLQRSGQAHLTQKQVLEVATDLEGHPDNVAPALLGGIISSVAGGDAVHATALHVACWPHILAFIPDSTLATNKARLVLPQTVGRADAIFNLSRLGMLVALLCNGQWRENPELMRVALQDRMHQTYRSALMPAYTPVEKAALQTGALGVTLSGAGPAMLVWLPCDASQELVDEMTVAVLQAATAQGVTGQMRLLDIDTEGCVEVRSSP